MSRQWTERELKRVARETAGHARDKDRARRKRRLTGRTGAGKPEKQHRPEPTLDDEPIEEPPDTPDES